MLLPYERDKAVAYARRWALGKNVEFGYFGIFYAGPIAWVTAAVIVTIGYFINIRRVERKFAK